MVSFRVFDYENEEVLLPEQDSEETKDSRYSTPMEALKAYQKEIGPLENFYQNEQIKIQELERIGWVDIQKIPSKREIWRRAQAEDFQQLEQEIDEK